MTTLLDARPSRPRRRASRVRTIAELFFHRLMQSIYAQGAQRRRAGRRWARLADLARQRQAFALETLEPRLLLSANLTYPTLSLVADMTLVADLSGSDPILELRETGNLGNVLASAVLDNAGEHQVVIQRDGGDTNSDLRGDTIRIDLDSFDLPALATFVNGDGGLLDIDFVGGKDISFLEGVIPGIGNDLFRLQGTGPTSVGFNLRFHSSSDIEVAASTFTLTGGKDLTVESDSTIHMTGTTLSAHDVTLNAGKPSTVTGDADSADFLQLPSAEVTVTNSTISGHDITILALSQETVTINTASKLDGKVNFSELLLFSSATVDLDNADLAATGTIDIDATSSMPSLTLARKPDPTDGSKGNTETTTDASFAVAVVSSSATVTVHNDSDLVATGAATIDATNTVHLTTTADGTLGNSSTAGAIVAVSVVFGDTEVVISDATTSIDASSVAIAATTSRTVDTTAKASPKGAKDHADDGSQTSKERLKDPNDDSDTSDRAATGEGNVNFAATVAVSVITGHTWAEIDDATITSDTTIGLTASGTYDIATIGDGSTTDNNPEGVGLGVGIGVHVVEVKAWLTGSPSLDGPNGITVHAVMPDSHFDVTAKSGASGGSSGLALAGALAINVTIANVYALVDPAATVDLNGSSLTLLAESTTHITARAEASIDDDDGDDDAGKSTGVGASVALTVADNDTKATIGSGVVFTDADDVHLTATATHTIETEAKGGGAGGNAIAPVVAVSVVTLDTATQIQGTALQPALVVGGELLADASGTSDVSTKAEGKAVGTDVAVGVAIAFGWAQDTVVSETTRSVTTGGATRFKAKGRSKSLAEAKASAEGGEGEGSDSSGKNAQQKSNQQRDFGNTQASANRGSGSHASGADSSNDKAKAQNQDNDNVSVAAGIAVNVAKATARAEIADGVTIDSDGALTVQASENVDASATADGTVANAGTGIAAAVAINVALVTNSAHIGDATITADGVSVKAEMTDVVSEVTDKHSFSAQATSGAGADDISIAASVAINYSDVDTTASIETGATLNLADGGDGGTGVGGIQLTATSVAEDTAKALPDEDSDGEGGADSAGIGASFALNLVLHDTTAELENGVAVTGTGIDHLSAQATGKDDLTTEAKNGAKGDTGIGAAVAVVISENHTTARVGTGGVVHLGGGASQISTDHQGTFGTTVSSEAEGSDAAIGASVGVVVVTDSSTATLARSVDNASGSFTVQAKSKMSSTLEVNASAGGEKKQSEGGQSADSKSSGAANTTNVTGNAGSQSTPSASGQTSAASGTAGGESGGGSSGVGVAAAVAVSYIGLDNIAEVASGADITTTGAVKVSAQAEVDETSKALGLAVTLEDSNMIGAAVGVNVASINNKARVLGGSVIHGDGITVEAVTTGSNKNEFIVWGAAAAGGTGDIGIAGSVAVNVVTFTTEASVANTAHLLSTGALHVTAENQLILQTIAAGVGFSSGTSVGAAVAVTVVTSDTDAFIAGAADAAGALTVDATTTLAPPPTLDLPDNSVVDDPAIAISSAALAGGGSNGGVGIAGAADITIYTVNTHAYIAGTAAVNQDGSITPSGQSVGLHASSTIDMTNAAGALGISTDSTGVGAGLEVSVISKDTEAYITTGATVDSAGALTVDADSSEDIVSIAANAGIGNSVGVAGSGTVQVLTTTTRAYIGGATVHAGDISVTADGHLDATMVAGSIGASAGSAGVGAAASVLVHTDTVEAYIGDNAVVTSDGATGITIAATSSEDLITIAAAGGGASTAGVAGSAVVNVLTEHTHAFIGRSANITVNDGASGKPDLSVHAQDDTDIVSVAGNLAAGGTAGVGLGADVATITKDTLAYIDSNVTAEVEGDIEVSAVASEDVTSVAAGMSLSGTASVALDASVHIVTNQTRAWIGDDPTGGPASAGAGHVHAGGNVVITADDQTEMDKIVGVLAVSGTAGVAASGAVSVVSKTTEAFIGAGAWVSGDGTTSAVLVNDGSFGESFNNAAPTFDPNNAGGEGIHADSVSSSPESTSLKAQGEVHTPTMSNMDSNNDGNSEATDPSLSGARSVSPGQQSRRGVALAATNRDDIATFTISVAGGTAGVAISAGVNVISTNTNAYIGDNAQVNLGGGADAAQSVSVAAGNDFYHLAVAGSLGVGVVGVAPSVDVTVLSNTTLASIGAGAVVHAMNDVEVEAHADEHVVQVAFGLGGGVVGIGGAVDVLTINNTTTATIGNATVVAGGDVAVIATDNTDITMVSGGIAGGFVGICASVGVMVINKDTSAFIANGADVDADGSGSGFGGILNGEIGGGDPDTLAEAHGVIVQAQSKEQVLHLVIAAGVGFVGVSGAVAVTLVDSDTTAFIGSNASINQGAGLSGDADQGVYVGASNQAHLSTFVVGVAGGVVGVGGAVDVGSLNNDTLAEIRSGAVVDAENDVEVNAVGIHEVDGFTLSGAGGLVGLTAAVSVWSVGNPISSDYQNDEGTHASATAGDNGSATDDAADQGGKSSGQVSGLLGGFSGDGSGNSKTSQNRVDSGTQSAGTSLSGSAPSTTAIQDAVTGAAPSTGTVARIQGGTTNVEAGHNIEVTANEDVDIEIITGGVAGGFVGVGASIAVVNVGVNAEAEAGGTLKAGSAGHINVKGILDDDIVVTSLSGSVGFVGLGAAVVAIGDASTVSAGILNNATIIRAGSVLVSAVGDQNLHGHAGQLSIGAVGAGAAFVIIDVDNGSATDTRAFIGSNVEIGQSGTVGSVSVSAASTVTAYAQTEALAGGIGAMAGNFAFVDVTPEIEATIGTGGHITVTGGVSVAATATPFARAETFGIAVGVLGAGFSLADVEASPVVTAVVAGTIVAGSLSVTGKQQVGASGYTAKAKTTGSAGGLVGLDATISEATDNGEVSASIGDNSTLTITGQTKVEAKNDSRQLADSSSNTVGLVAGGIATGIASSDTVTHAFVGNNVKLTGGTLVIIAHGTDDNFADTVSGSIGFVLSGAAAVADTNNDSTTTAEILGGNSSLRKISLAGGGGLDVTAEHTAKFNTRLRTFSGGLLAGAGGSADNDVTAHTTARVGANAIVVAKDIDVEAITHAYKPSLGEANFDGTAGGFISGGGGDDTSTINFTTLVDVGVGASLDVIGDPSNPGGFILKAYNDFDVHDKVVFDTIGAFSGLAAYSTIVTNTDLAKVNVGANASLTSIGAISLFARGGGTIKSNVEAEAIGLATVILVDAKSRVYPDNEIFVGAGAFIHAKGDLGLYAGTDANFVRDNYVMDATAETVAGSAIPLGDTDSHTILITDNTITISTGALLETAGEATLQAERKGLSDLSGLAKGTSWVSAVQDFLNGAATAFMQDADIEQEGHGTVIMNGTVRTGIERHKMLTLFEWADEGVNGGHILGEGVGYTQTGGVTFTSQPEVVSSELLQELQHARDQLNQYGNTNATLKAFYEGEIARIEGELAAEGLFEFRSIEIAGHGLSTGDTVVYHNTGGAGAIGPLVDGQSYYVRKISNNQFALSTVNTGNVADDYRFFPAGASFTHSVTKGGTTLNFDLNNLKGVAVGQYAVTVTVDPQKAEAGRIDIRTDQLQGTGTFDAPGDASIDIQNHTPAFLKLNGLTIPEVNGGLFLNGNLVTTNAQIFSSNVLNAAEDNSITPDGSPGDHTIVPGTASFASIPDNAASTPTITVDNDFIAGTVFHEGKTRIYAWPDIVVQGQGISNLGGDVTLTTYPGGEGNIIILASVQAKNLTIIAGGTVFITDVTNFAVAGEPEAIWGDITKGVIPGSIDATLYPGLFSAIETDAAALTLAEDVASPPTEYHSTYNSPTAGPHAQIDNLLSDIPTDVNLYGQKIFIDAEYINVNGLMQSGKDTYHLVLGATVANEISTLTPADGVIVNLTSYTNKDFIVKYNTATQQIIVDAIRNRGGQIDLTGHVLNTGNGIIRVLGGYANFEIDNTTGYDLVLNKVDDSIRGAGTLTITDKAKPGTPYFVLYKVQEDGSVQRTIDDGVGGLPTDVSTLAGSTDTYTPDAGWRYGWQRGARTRDYFYYHHDVSAWLGIDWLSVDPETVTWDQHEPLGPPVLLGNGPYYFKDLALDGVKYTFDYEEIHESEKKIHIIDQHSDSTWYGETTYHNEIEAEQDNLHVFTHTIESDRPISVQFIGFTQGDIDVDSNGNVILNGPVTNPTGTTKISTTKSIIQQSADAVVAGQRIELIAGTGVGTDQNPITTDLSENSSASLKATTTSGEVHIDERFGDLRVDQVKSQHNIFGSGGEVTLTSQGGIFVASGHEGLVEGGAIGLTANGAVGANGKPLILDAGVFQWDKVNIAAGADIYVQEKDGNLNVESISTPADVHITVVNGGVVDANEAETRDERTYEQLLAGPWHDLRLTAGTGANAKVQDVKDSLAALREQEYQTYWEYRHSQPSAPLTIHEASVALGGGVKYYAIVAGDTMKLALSAGDAQSGKAIDIDGTGATGSGHGITVGTGLFFDAKTAVDGTAETITLAAHGLSEGDAVTYSQETHGTSIGLTEGLTYYVSVVDANTIKLKAHLADAGFVNLTANGSPASQALYRVRLFSTSTDLDNALDAIDLGTGHGLATGDVVRYSVETGDTAVHTVVSDVLAPDGTYYIVKVDDDHVRLAVSALEAGLGHYLDLDSTGALGTQHRLDAGGVGTGLFDPLADVDSATDTIHIAGHGLSTGAAVKYRSNVFDIAFPVHLRPQEEAFYRTQLGYDDAAILALEASRTAQYHTLNTQYGEPGGLVDHLVGLEFDGFDASFAYTLTAQETSDIEGSIHIFTEEELLYTISTGLLKDIADTSPTIEEPNITGANLVITASKGVGKAVGVTTIDVSGGVHNLTNDERVALAAAERVDVTYLGPAVTTTVDVTGPHTFHRTSGTWDPVLFAPDTRIHVTGGANATDVGEFYVVASVSGADLVVTANLLDQDGVVLTIAPEVNDPTAPGANIHTIVIDQREDVDVEIVDQVDVGAHDSVYLGSETHNINLGLVQTDLDDDIRIKSGQSILNVTGGTNVIGGDTILEAANGSIGTAVTPVKTDLGASATITARALGAIYLVEQNDDMNVEFMFSQSGVEGVHLTALDGSILDALDTDFTKINANHVVLTAHNGGIGEPGDYLDVDVNGTGTLVADADDDIFVSETFGDMNVEHVQSNSGNVDLDAFTGSIFDAMNTPAAEIIGNSITLTAFLGIGVSGNDVDINSRLNGAGVLTSYSNLANTYIIEVLGDLYLNTAGTGPAFTAFLTAPTGSILNSNVSPQNVVSGKAYLVARDDIGAAGNPLNTEIGFLEGKAILGSTWIVNTGDLTEGGVVDSGDPGMAAGGDITVTADSPIDITENVVALNITYIATDDSADDHLVVRSGFFLKTAVYDFGSPDADATGAVLVNGTITLHAGDDFHLEGGASLVTGAGGHVIIDGDFGNSDPGLGSTIDVDGTIQTGDLVISGNSDADTILVDDAHVTAASFVEVHGGGGGDTILTKGTVTAPEIRYYGEDGDDAITFDYENHGPADPGFPTHALTGHVEVFGGAGHDLVTVNELHTRASTLDIDGQGDTDDVVVNVRADATATDYVINVFDTGAPDDGADTLTINGTEVGDSNNPDGEDLFLVRRNFVAYLTPDPAHLPEPDPQHLLAGVERINYDENVNGRLIVNGYTGADAFYSDDNSSITTLDGGAGDDFFQVGQVFGAERIPPAVAPGDEIATIYTTKGWLSRGVTFPMVVYGGSGNDTMQVYANQAELRLEGNAGDDTFIIRAFALADPLTGEVLKDLSTAAQAAALGGDGNDLIQYTVNAPVDIDGGTGFNRIVVLGTEFSDNFAISEEGIFGAGLHITFENVQSITVDGLEGNDNFFVLSTPADVAVNVVGGIGWDTFNVGGDVTLPIVSRDLEGISAVINHQVTSTDPAYDNLPAEGVDLHVATPASGQIVIEESGGATTVGEAGATEDSYDVSLAAAPTDDVYITVSAAGSPSEAGALGAATLLVSIDGGATFQPAAVLTFAAGTPAGTKKTVTVKAIDDVAPEGDGLVIVSMSSRSLDDDFNHVAIRNVKVRVLDDDQPGLRLTHTDLDTVVLEEDAAAGTHGLTDSYTLELAKAPAAGQTVTVTLSPSDARLALSSLDPRYNAGTQTFTFDESNWDVAATVDVAAAQDFVVQNPVTAQISHAVGGTDASYTSFFATKPAPKLNVKLIDTDGAGVYVRETDGSTLVVKGDPTGDTYSLRLTHAPAAAVTIALLTDDQTLVDSAVVVPPGGPVFTPAVLDADGLVVTPATVTFDATNWFTPFVVRVTANPQAPPTDEIQPLKFFPVQPHVASTAIQGALTIDGSVGPEDRSIRRAVILPTETDPGPVGEVITTDDTGSVDTLNIFNDGSGANDVGTLTGSNLFMNGMGPDLHFVGEDGTPHDFAKGINYTMVETLEVMLGRGDDSLTIDGTMAAPDGTRGPLTLVHGGGGSDTITINGGGGAGSPLVVFGDTSQDGSRYVGTSGVASVHAIAFNNPGDDVIDARNATQSVTIFGGRGDDTIWGSQAGDHLAGGSGHDTIHGQDGDDIIYGDDGFNVHKTTVSIPEPNQDSGVIDRTLYDRELVTVFAVSAPIPGFPPDTHDTLTPGQDTLFGDGGADIEFGDFGLVTQTIAETLLSTAGVIQVESKSNSDGADDTMYGNAGDDILIGNTGSDAIDGGLDKDLIFGDNVSLDRSLTLGDFTNPRFRVLSGTQVYSTAAATAGQLLINSASQYADPRGSAAWADFQITLLDHANGTPAVLYGNDYIAGGGGDDTVFGELGDDVIQGDGSIDFVSNGSRVGASRDAGNALVLNPSFDAATDGDDYVEGNGGNDVILGNQGQDDIIGGSSTLFSLETPNQRPDGSDLVFGGSGTAVARNDAGNLTPQGHATDADVILGDNGNIYRLLGVNDAPGGGGGVEMFGGFLAFNYDTYTNDPPAVPQAKIVVRGVQLVDYTPGGLDYAQTAAQAATDIGAADELHGEGGDDVVYGMKGNDVLFGEGQDDDLVAGYGNDWISGGAGDDGVLGDDGRLFTSRNGTAEPLYGIGSLAGQLDLLITTPGNVQSATINVSGQLKKTADLTPFSVDVTFNGTQDEFGGSATVAHKSDDIIYGGVGNDTLHGGSGDDAISGAEAPVESYAQLYDATDLLIGVIRTDYGHPLNLADGDILRFNPDDPDGWHVDRTRRAGEFALYDEYDPLRKILLTDVGELSKTGAGKEFFLNFVSTEGAEVATGIFSDGNDALFGDTGNDWLVGGTGRDDLYGGWGNDLLNADDVLTTAGGLNNAPDTAASYEDRAFGGAGRDVLIGNTGGDRLIDWAGEFNSYLVPFAPFGMATVSRTLQPQLAEFLYQLSANDGADPTRAADTGADPTRNGEPEGELAVIRQQDFAWHDQTGAPTDPQPGNVPGGKRDVLRSANFNDGTAQAFFADSGAWTVSGGALQVSAQSLGGDAVAVYQVGDALPAYFEMLASVDVVKPTAGWKGNAYLIFDYNTKTDFKFTGIDISTNKLVAGHRDASGWHVDKQTPFLAKADTYYNMMLSINGLNATIIVNNKDSLTYTFAPRVIDGWSYGLNWGLVGVGSDNSRGSFDNVQVQVVQAAATFQSTEDFGDGVADLFTGATSGTWAVSGGRYVAVPPSGGTAAKLIDLGVGGLQVSSVLELSSIVNTQGRAGFVFDRYGADDFKFAAIDAPADKVVIGHYTAKNGWVIDASVARTINAGTDYTLGISLKGSTVSVTLNGQAVVGFAFNAVVVDGGFGVFATGGAASFDNVTIKTTDPAFAQSGGQNMEAAAIASAPAATGTLDVRTLDGAVDTAIRQWTDTLGNGDSRLGALADFRFAVAELDGPVLATTVGRSIVFDADAAGYGWIVGGGSGGVDLLTVAMHELGHVMGFAHEGVADVMSPTLTQGERLVAHDTGSAQPVEVALGGPVRLAPAAPGIDWSAGAFAGLSTRDEQRGGGVLAALRDFRIFDGDAAGDLWSSLTTAARRGELSRPESAESHLLDWSIDVAPDIELVEASPATAISGA